MIVGRRRKVEVGRYSGWEVHRRGGETCVAYHVRRIREEEEIRMRG